MKIAMIGAGYVGLVTGAGLAEFGNDVTCVDSDHEKVNMLSQGEIPIYEPGLDKLVQTNLAAGRLRFTTIGREAIKSADIIFIAVGTPSTPDGGADLASIFSVAREIGEVLQKFDLREKIIVLKSTVPVGTTDTVSKILGSFCKGGACIANNPEFLREGTAVEDFMRPDRVIIGTTCIEARDALIKLYRPFTNSGKILVMDPNSSELVKYASNAMLAIRIAFMNEMAVLASSVGANISSVREGVGRDGRIGDKYLYSGPGYGGSCLPKDVSALIDMGDGANAPMRIARAAHISNSHHKHQIVERMELHLDGLRNKKIAVWGLSFKADTDDIRDSPSVSIIEELLRRGAVVHAVDPQAATNARKHFGNRVSFSRDQYGILENAHAMIVATEWREFRSPDFGRIRSLSPNITIFDVRNLWDAKDALRQKMNYFGMGTTSL
jgi:UDPglucose 6-dehydrogenase